MDVDNEGKRSDSACFACWTVLAGICYYRGKPIPNTDVVEELGRFVGRFVPSAGDPTVWDSVGAGLWSIAKGISTNEPTDKDTASDEHNVNDTNNTNEVINYEEE